MEASEFSGQIHVSLNCSQIHFRKKNLSSTDHSLNPLSPNSDGIEISLYVITTSSNIQVMRIKEVITKDKMS